MAGKLCIHGHFYQPPREDPWLGRILLEPSAAPMRHWNERIVRESYAPLGWARRMDSDGRITELLNCYEWISFNAGPTLLHWMRRENPNVLERMVEGDRLSQERWGHGNAIAQVYHHIIMPLASELDKELECVWAIADFQARFKRKPEGMWLSECAVDSATLQTLAAEGIKFVILAPRQAEAIAAPGQDFTPTHEGILDVTIPYKVELPGGREIAVVFYHGAISQAIAFEGLLSDGERFWQRLSGAARQHCGPSGLLTISTDGETYGHHFKFGEMALAHAIGQGISGRDQTGLTNIAAWLAENPPVTRVRLREPSSWSCVHGVERWRADCGCTDGGHPGWNQRWRGPLREALNFLKAEFDKHFFTAGAAVFLNPHAALREYGEVLANPDCSAEFATRHFIPTHSEDRAWKLLSMQENALASFASCAWFFDDISRIEPVNAMGFALKAMELAHDTGCPDLQPQLQAILAQAVSNKPDEGSGAKVFQTRVLPKQQDAAALCLMALIWLQAGGRLPLNGQVGLFRWPALEVEIHLDDPARWEELSKDDSERPFREITGRAELRHRLAGDGLSFLWAWQPPSNYLGNEFTGLEGEGLLEARHTPLSFVSLRDSSLEAYFPDGSKARRNAAELPRHVREFLCLRLMGQKLHRDKERRKILARHLISALGPWEEGQQTLAYPQLWAEFLPYLIWACCFGQENSPEQVERCAAYIKKQPVSPDLRRRCLDLLEQDFIHGLRSYPVPARKLQNAIKQAKALLPGADWWPVQNELWQHPELRGELKELGREFGFRL